MTLGLVDDRAHVQPTGTLSALVDDSPRLRPPSTRRAGPAAAGGLAGKALRLEPAHYAVDEG